MTLDRVRDGIIGSLAVALTFLAGLLLMQATGALSLQVLELYGAAVEQVSAELAAIGALLLFAAVPPLACWVLYVFITRKTANQEVTRLVGILIFLGLIGLLPGLETVHAALPADAAAVFDSYSAALWNTIMVGLTAWLLFKTVRWLVADESDARRSGDSAPS